MLTGLVSEITSFSTMDGPGIRTTVFLKGCPLRCKWCSNPETWEKRKALYYIPKKCKGCGKCEQVCPNRAISSRYTYPTRIDRKKCNLCFKCVETCPNRAFKISGREYTVREMLAFLEKEKIFYSKEGGLTFSGGEPLMQDQFVYEVFKACRDNKISTVLDTSGFGNTDSLKKILEYTDLVLLDIKLMNDNLHKKWTGISNKLILKNAAVIASTVPVRISLPLIQGVNDTKENLYATAEFALANGISHIDVMPLHTLGAGKYRYLGMYSPYAFFSKLNKNDLNYSIELLRRFGLEVSLGRMM